MAKQNEPEQDRKSASPAEISALAAKPAAHPTDKSAEPDVKNVTIQAQTVSLAPPTVENVFDINKSRADDDKRLAKGDHNFAVQTIMKQLGVSQDAAEDQLAKLDQTQCNDLIDAANSNRIDHIHRVLAGMTLTDAENLPDSNEKEDLKKQRQARQDAANAEAESAKKEEDKRRAEKK